MSLEEVSADEVRGQIKKALLIGDMHTAEKLLMSNPEVFGQMERMQLMEQIQRAQFGTMNPIQNADLMAMAAKM